MGMPDDWTKIAYRGKSTDECPDGPRYRAIGNSMAVSVMRWIGERIAEVERKMARIDFMKYRRAIWQVARGCCECDKENCDGWCVEMRDVQLDEIIERIAADVRASISRAS